MGDNSRGETEVSDRAGPILSDWMQTNGARSSNGIEISDRIGSDLSTLD